jgi:chromosome segregation protein
MRLASIKLAGFKSFVDPTNLPLPTNLTGVVGPNGCGKSNIIDAIRWVMGESAASRLRGDAMTDVIFNGSSERKPVNQAMVELIFDNSAQTITGEFAAYSEISVRRTVSRDGQSQYYLNNQRCRRRDITDLFLGTGLGARSYSIIEQGMISQIVEAAPEDLRAHLEEAAGISKYKDRRKETESRIKGTRENLDRLGDVREEVDKQLEHLERQAKQAERYRELKAEQRRKDAELKAHQWRHLHAQQERHQSALTQSEHELEALATASARLLREGESLRLEHHELGDAFARVQQDNFQVSSELARLEQELKYRHETLARLAEELEQTRLQAEQMEAQFGFDANQLETLVSHIAIDEPKLETLKENLAQQQDKVARSESELAAVRKQLELALESGAKAAKSAEVERTKIDLIERQLSDALKRREGLLVEASHIDIEALSRTQSEATERLKLSQHELAEASEQLEERKQRFLDSEQALSELESLRAAREACLAQAKARLSSLEALQHAALGHDKQALNSWLTDRGLADGKRLAEVLVVDEGYEGLVERVLDDLLEALVLDQTESALQSGQIPPLPLSALEYHTPVRGPSGTLASKVHGPRAVMDWLRGIRLASDVEQALAARSSLAPGDSLICPDGSWIGCDWIRLPGVNKAHDGVLVRARVIEQLQAELEALENELQRARREIEKYSERKKEELRARDELQNLSYQLNRKVSEAAGAVQAGTGRVENARTRLERIGREISDIDSRMHEQNVGLKDARALVSHELDRMQTLEQDRGQAESRLKQLQSAVGEARQQLSEAQSQTHQLELGLSQKRTAKQSLEAAMQRIEQQKQQIAARTSQLRSRNEQTEAPIPELKRSLALALDQKALKEAELSSARKALDDCAHRLMKLDAERVQSEQRENRLRDKRAQDQLAAQAVSIRAETLRTQVAELEFELETLLVELTEETDLSPRATELTEIEAKIKRLEPVNLAAIQELEETRQRKGYLDSQVSDLTQALETLEEAIRKIDRETRTRFKDTFDQVNDGIQEIFPKLFGGGHAALELTGEDLLTTGVNIIARPPGKRPSSIALLSGGEKALTAVSLVFAIFRLNPAPFCLLDEVDAPLDEANVGRFCQLVRDMSNSVQFLFVTHNKVTMELALQLAGVTMREAGVSRLVHVDLAEAAKLVEH